MLLLLQRNKLLYKLVLSFSLPVFSNYSQNILGNQLILRRNEKYKMAAIIFVLLCLTLSFIKAERPGTNQQAEKLKSRKMKEG